MIQPIVSASAGSSEDLEQGPGSVPASLVEELGIRLGRVLAATRIPNSRLTLLRLDVGDNAPRTIVTGSKKPRPTEDWIGIYVPVICNLQPRALFGHVSDGMLLSSYDAEQSQVILAAGDTDSEESMAGLRVAAATRVPRHKLARRLPPRISYDRFAQLDIRLGTVIDAVRVPRSQVSVLRVDVGGTVPHSVIVSHRPPGQEPKWMGLQVAAVWNLKPRQLYDYCCHGQLLAAYGPSGRIIPLVARQYVPPGALAR